jgi:hypothetical protein
MPNVHGVRVVGNDAEFGGREGILRGEQRVPPRKRSRSGYRRHRVGHLFRRSEMTSFVAFEPVGTPGFRGEPLCLLMSARPDGPKRQCALTSGTPGHDNTGPRGNAACRIAAASRGGHEGLGPRAIVAIRASSSPPCRSKARVSSSCRD